MNFIKKQLVLTVLLVAISLNFPLMSFAEYAAEAVAKYNQGIDYSHRGDYESAVEYFKQAVAIDPTFMDAYYNLGSIYEYLKKDNEALTAFLQLVKNNPSDKEAVYKVAYLFYKQGNYKNALSYVVLVPTTSPKYKDAQLLRKKIEQKVSLPAKTSKPSNTMIRLKRFQGPTGITQDKFGNLYVANFTDNSVVKISPSGTRQLLKKGGLINGPIGIALDKANNVYVACYNSNKIVKISSSGTVSEFLKNIQKPYYLFINDSGFLVISEQGSNTVIIYKL